MFLYQEALDFINRTVSWVFFGKVGKSIEGLN
jgi:hypothetical protein